MEIRRCMKCMQELKPEEAVNVNCALQLEETDRYLTITGGSISYVYNNLRKW